MPFCQRCLLINNLMVVSANNLIVLCFLCAREDRYGVYGGRGRKEECARLRWRARTTPEPGFQGHKWEILQETHGAKAGIANQTV
jgi:hypothetical protein